jgi:hypothetical protein
LFLIIVAAAWLINVFLSAQMVDQSQGRLRNPPKRRSFCSWPWR